MKVISLLLVCLLVGCVQPGSGSGGTSCTYRDGGALPDPNCTPGVTDPRVTQDNIQTTICRSGYTTTVRPPESYTNSLKVQQMREYKATDPISTYEEDHYIPLELGGHPTDPHNLWPEPGASPNAKDRVENELHRLVCEGKVSLVDAQTRIKTDWRKAID